MIRQAPRLVAWRVRELVWTLDEKVVWPVTDAVTEEGLGETEVESHRDRRARWRRHWPDVVLALVLLVVAVLSRRHALPTDGLWQDDSEPGASVKAPLSQLILVGKDHPGFIALLKGWKELTNGSTDSLATPPFVAGILGPPLLYLGLRALRFARSISFLLAAALAAAITHIVNSGRVRTFTIDLLVVLGLAVLLPRLARIRWSWSTAVGWFAGSVLIASISGFALGASIAAAAILLLHPKRDLRVRLVAVGAQVLATGGLYFAEARNYSASKIESLYRDLGDAFPHFHLNPISTLGDLLVHLRRLAETFPGGAPWFALVCGLVAVAGLAVACLPGRRAIAARFLVLVLVATVVASLFGKVPFGPEPSSAVGNNARVSIWLVPVLAVGLAVALQAVRRLFEDQRGVRLVFDGTVFAIAAVILVTAGPAVRYPFPGARSATRYIEANLKPGDAVILPFHTQWSFAAESSFPVKMEASPEFTESFEPESWGDPRIHYIDQRVDPAQVAEAVRGANRVFVYYPALKTGGLVPQESQTRTAMTTELSSLGLRVQDTLGFQDDNAAVDVLGRGATPGKVNLEASDFPRGWRLTPLPSPSAERLISCTGGAPPAGEGDSVVATGPHQLNVISRLDQWPSERAASQAASALRGPAGAACAQSVLEQTFEAAGVPLDITVTPESPPPAFIPGAVVYRVSGRDRTGGTAGAAGSVVFFSRGATSALLLALRGDAKKPFSQALVTRIEARLAQRLEGSR